MRIPRLGRALGGKRGIHSLRGKLTLANVALLALGIVAATVASVMGMRYYLLDQVDTELVKTRDSLGGSQLTLREIDSLSVLGFVRARLAPETLEEPPRPDSIFAAVDRGGEPVGILGFQPTDAQRGLAGAVADPRALI
jgi:two-component system OmpR family sensor kinase